MKKLFKIALLILVIIAVGYGIEYFFKSDIPINNGPEENTPISSTDIPNTPNSNMLLEKGQFKLSANENAIISYFNNDEIYPSKAKLEHMYGSMARELEANNQEYTNEMVIFITLKNDFDKYMTLKGTVVINYDDEHNEQLSFISFNWYDDVNIFSAFNDGLVNQSVLARYFEGSSLEVFLSVIGVMASEDGKYYKISELDDYSENQCNEVGKMLFDELFVIKQSTDSNDVGLGKVLINSEFLDAIYNENLNYDRENWGATPFGDFYYSNVNETDTFYPMLCFNYTYFNSATLDYRYFRLLIDVSAYEHDVVDVKDVILVEYDDYSFENIVIYQASNGYLSEARKEYDMSYYILENESINLCNVHVVDDSYIYEDDGTYFIDELKLYGGLLPDKVDFLTWSLSEAMFTPYTIGN